VIEFCLGDLRYSEGKKVSAPLVAPIVLILMKSMIKNNGHVICRLYYTGVMNRDLTIGLNDALHEFNNFLVTGMASSIVANRISYHFDIRGPSITVDTACSSALVSIHLGSQAIKSGECTLLYWHFVWIIITYRTKYSWSCSSRIVAGELYFVVPRIRLNVSQVTGLFMSKRGLTVSNIYKLKREFSN
jgi:hypothetical protein